MNRRWICHAAAASVGLFLIAPIVAMRFDNVEPVSITHTEMIPSDVRPGQTVRLSWAANEHRSCDGLVHRRFVDSGGVIFELAPVPTIYRTAVAHNKVFSRDIQIPSGMASGPAWYGGVRRYWCNPLQRLLQGWLGFEILMPVAPVRFNVLPP
jgi:hypothetical protein